VTDRPSILLITTDWKIVAYTNPAIGELYHLANDPNQLRNLWDDPDTLPQRARLLAELLAAMRCGEGVLRTRTMWA
jgi:arylsulfatase A-like enzyme